MSRISDSGGNKLRTIFKRHSQGVEYLEPKGKASDFTPHNFRHTMLTEAEALKRLGRGDFVDVVNQISLSHLGDASMKSVYGVDGTLLTKRIVKDLQTFNKLRKELKSNEIIKEDAVKADRKMQSGESKLGKEETTEQIKAKELKEVK